MEERKKEKRVALMEVVQLARSNKEREMEVEEESNGGRCSEEEAK